MNEKNKEPLMIINSTAPTRICDNGGWTDTWFAKYGKVFNIAVYPHAQVQIEVYAREQRAHQVVIDAENYADEYVRDVGTAWQKHPLIEAAIEQIGIPDEVAIQINLYSEAPPGASTGTSAAVTVALIGALDQLTEGRLMPHEVAYQAQQVETVQLGQQCGVQDQLAAAYGGLNYIDMFQYPHAAISPVCLPDSTLWELERRLALIYLGTSHSSTKVHEQVIHGLEDAGPEAPQLAALRSTAVPARDALYAGDFRKFGRILTQNTEYQRNLHPALISDEAQRIIEIAKGHGALGWKVNGAGGDGGSVTILCDHRTNIKRTMLRAIETENKLFQNIPVRISQSGLRVWKQKVN